MDCLALSEEDRSRYRRIGQFQSANNSSITQILVVCQWLLQHGNRCHGTGLKLRFGNDVFHPLKASFGHAIHGVRCSHGFSTPSPQDLSDDTLCLEAQNFAVESWFFNLWRKGYRRLIGALDLNKKICIEFSRLQAIDPALTLKEDDLERIASLPVRWRDSVDSRVDINVYDRTEQAIWYRLTSSGI